MQSSCLQSQIGSQHSRGQSPGVLATSLQSEIDHLASSNGAPSFVPHVTVVAGVEGSEQDIIQKATEAAAQLKVAGPHDKKFQLLIDTSP